jgi:CspA family cold shock protein
MIKGTVKFFNGIKGFGFITPDDGSKEVFVPTATVTASGESLLRAGQRVAFEAEQEARGPKAVKLKLLDEPVREPVREAPRPALTLYYEAEDEDAADVMAALSAAGLGARQVDYIATPPSREELKKLSVMLREANQSLARRYEPLFMELQLDDRFISETEFLTGIHEHPTLINGPILVAAGKARVCRTAEDVQAFLGNGALEEKRSKGISARMAAMMLGQAVPPAPAPEKEIRKEVRKTETAVQLAVIEEEEEEQRELPLPVPAPKAKAAVRPKKAAAPVKAAAPAKKPAAKAKPAKAVKAKASAKPAKKAKR